MKEGSTRNVVLFIAMSVDGCIADAGGGVGWLHGQALDGEDPDTYSEFVEGVDTVLMGWNTYHQIVTELSPEEWPYGGLAAYVFTHNDGGPSEGITFTDESPVELLAKLRQQRGKDIWVCGGADVAQQLMCAGMVDRYHLSVIPTLLGKGVRLFGVLPEEQRLTLVLTRNHNGIVELVYEPSKK